MTAEKNEIDAAIHRLEHQFHPDNLSEYDVRQIQGKLTEILEKARAAHRVLIDPRTRREYRHYLEVQERQRAKDEVLQAEIAFKEGEKALKKSDFITARDRFETAIRMKPDEPDYYAFLGWALFQGARGKPESASDIKRAKQELGRDIAMNPQSDKAFLILGRVYAGEGNIRFAEEHFEKALKVNPECVPAKVALDLIKKGKEAKAASAPDPGVGP
jgi:tetratricopeptide (TPR) repeat protein